MKNEDNNEVTANFKHDKVILGLALLLTIITTFSIISVIKIIISYFCN